MSQKLFCTVGGILFLFIAVGHLLRVIFGASAVVAGVSIPMWPSWVAFVVIGYLAIAGLRAASRPST
jgi:hypothetical protein